MPLSLTPHYSFVLLAAGRSERMQTDKALLDFHGKPWIQHQVEQIKKSPIISQIYVVTNPSNISLIRPAIAPPVKILENSQKDADTFSSVMIGLKSATKSDGIFISPIDVPIDGEIIDRLGNATREKSCKVISPEHSGKKGHPVLLLQRAVAELLIENSRFERLDFYIRSLKEEESLSVPVDNPLIHLNLNTPNAWSDFLKNA